MHISRSFIPNLLSLSVLAALQSAHAATPVDVDNTLPVTVVTASRNAEPINIVPASITVIGKNQIEQSPANDLPSLLRQDAGLSVVSSGGYGQVTSIFTRGTESDHTLILVDGVRLNHGKTSESSTNFQDLSDISQIEILKGPASVQYGSDAIGGVIQLISAKPSKDKLFTTLEAGENGLYKAIVGADLVKDDLYLQIRGQKMATDGTPVTTIAKQDAGYDQKGYSLKGGVDNADYALSFEARGNQGKVDYVDYDYASPLSQDFSNRILNLKGRYNIAPDLKINLRLSQYLDQLTQNDSSDFVRSNQKEADANITWGFAPHQNVLFGITDSTAYTKAVSYGSPFSHGAGSTGYYLQHQYQDDIFSTQAGVRVEDNKDFGTHTTGQLAGRMKVLPQTSIYANIGSAFRAPNAYELFGPSGSTTLKPEQSNSYEIGLDQKIAHGLDGNIAIYRTDIDNLIASNPLNHYKYYNIDKSKLTGAEAGLKWKLDSGWFVSGNYSYVQPIAIGQNGKADSDLIRRPRQGFNAAAGLQLNSYGFSIDLVSKNNAKDYLPAYGTPGYLIGNLHAYWQADANVRVFANIANVTDRKYGTAVAGVPPFDGALSYYIAQRREATLGVTLSY